ncbi:MAG: TIM barrel protein [Tepidisphaeraceae bacterium]|jgi:sugar phosphate isomerase/epimerase
MQTRHLITIAVLFALALSVKAADPARPVGTSASFKGPVGLQMYSLRDISAKDNDKALAIAKGFGITEIELHGTGGMSNVDYRKHVEAMGFKPISTHLDYAQFEKDPEAAAVKAEELGLSFVGVAWIPHQGQFDEATCRKAAAVFNRAGEVLAKHNIRFFYHNHGYEFVPFGDGTLFDLLVKETKPEFVSFEMDIFWIVHPGQDPVKLLKKYPDRWQLFHLKDMKKGVATGKLTGSEDVNNDVALGSGQIDLSAALKAAQEIGVKHYFIEDESPRAVEQIPQSLKYLESLAW